MHNKSSSHERTLLDTGINAMTGARIKKAEDYVGNESFSHLR